MFQRLLSTLTMASRNIRRLHIQIALGVISCITIFLLFSSISSNEAGGWQLQEKRPATVPSPNTSSNTSPSTSPSVDEILTTRHNHEEDYEHTLPVVEAPLEISENLRTAIPQNSAFWNQRQHKLFQFLDYMSSLNGNVTREVVQNPSLCSPSVKEMLHVNIPDFDSYPELHQIFLQAMDCRDYPILIDQPQKCRSLEGASKPFLLLAIKSVPGNFEARQVVRSTWGQEFLFEGELAVRIVFLLGTTPPEDVDFQPLVSLEAKHFGDILQWDFRDSFYNLTLKQSLFLKWALKQCPQASFVFQGDDDVFTNTPALLKYLRSLEHEKASKLYLGHILDKTYPSRYTVSKYYIPKTLYEGAYPGYAGGGGFVFSGPLMEPFYRVSQYIAFFPIDDVYTGMIFQALGIIPQDHQGFKTFDIKAEDRENPCVHKDLFVVHRRSPQELLRLWRKMKSPLLVC